MNRRNRGRAGLLTAALLIGATALPAQTTPQSRRAQRDSDERLARAHAQLVLRIDSLTRLLDLEPLDDDQRLRLSRQVNALVTQMGRLMAERAATMAAAAQQLRQLDHDEPMEAGAAAEDMARAMTQVWQVTPSWNGGAATRGWIGLNVEAPHLQTVSPDGEVLVRYLDYPAVVSVEPNSPAERAGARTGEVLIAFNGRDVRQNDINVTQLLRPTHRIRVTLRRPTADGDVTRVLPMTVAASPSHVLVRRRDFATLPPEAMPAPALAPMPPSAPRTPRVSVEVAPTPAPAAMPMADAPPGAMGARGMTYALAEPNAIAGATLATLNADLGRAFGVRNGVLVLEAANGTPAREAGLRGGDVIVRAGGLTVRSVAQLRRVIEHNADDRRLTLDVVRSKRTRKIVLEW